MGGLPQDLLPQTSEEYRPGEHADGLVQHLYLVRRRRLTTWWEGESAQNAPMVNDEAQTGGFGSKIPPQNELPGIRVQKNWQ